MVVDRGEVCLSCRVRCACLPAVLEFDSVCLKGPWQVSASRMVGQKTGFGLEFRSSDLTQPHTTWGVCTEPYHKLTCFGH